MLSDKTVKTLVVFLITTILFTTTSLSANIQGCSGCSSYHVVVSNEQDTNNRGLAGNITIELAAWPLWFQVIAFPLSCQPLYDLWVENHNNRPIDCYVKQELSVEERTLHISNRSYTLRSYPAMNPVHPLMKWYLMEEYPEFQIGVFNVYVEVFIPEDDSKNSLSFSGFYFHGFVWIFGWQYHHNFYTG